MTGIDAATEESWAELAVALAAVESEETHVVWEGGEHVGTTISMPYATYSDAVERLRRALGGVGALVPFDWQAWDGHARYPTKESVAAAPVEDVVRLVTAIIRSERFFEGSLAATLEDGRFQAATRRLLDWHDAGSREET